MSHFEKITIKRRVSHQNDLKCRAFIADPQYSQEEYVMPSPMNYYRQISTTAGFYYFLNQEMQRMQYKGQYSYAPRPVTAEELFAEYPNYRHQEDFFNGPHIPGHPSNYPPQQEYDTGAPPY